MALTNARGQRSQIASLHFLDNPPIVFDDLVKSRRNAAIESDSTGRRRQPTRT
jgi:hypothetical protein